NFRPDAVAGNQSDLVRHSAITINAEPAENYEPQSHRDTEKERYSTRPACEAGRFCRSGQRADERRSMTGCVVRLTVGRPAPPLRGAASNISVPPCLCGSFTQ